MRRLDPRQGPYGVDVSPLSGGLSSLEEELKDRIKYQLNAIAELAGLMPPPVPLQGLGPNFDAYSLRIEDHTIFYSVDPIRRRITLRDVTPRLPPTTERLQLAPQQK